MMLSLTEALSNVQNMKDFILSYLNDHENENNIKSIYNMVLKKTIGNERFGSYFVDRGIEDAKENILRILADCGDLDIFVEIVEHGSPLPQLNLGPGAHNIYSQLSTLGFDQKTLQELAKLCKQTKGKNSRGIFEILISLLFDKVGISPKIKPSDIYINDDEVEVKGYGGRLNSQGTPLAKKSNDYLRKFKISILDNQSNVNDAVKTLLVDHSKEEITEIISRAMIAQFVSPKSKIAKEWVEFVKTVDLWKQDEIRYETLQRLWGTLDLYSYCHFTESGGRDFDYILIFKKNPIDKGDYIVLNKENELSSFETLYNDNRLDYDAYPRSSSNLRDSVVKIYAK